MEPLVVLAIIVGAVVWLRGRGKSTASSSGKVDGWQAPSTPAGRGVEWSPQVDPQVNATVIIPDRYDASLEIVGERHRLDAVRAAASSGPLQEGMPAKIGFLVADPKNPYDPNAVAVFVNGIHVGYLAREDAIRYQPVVRHMAAQGKVIGCEASVLLVRGSEQVVLRLGSPAETMLDCPGGEVAIRDGHEWPAWNVAFTGDSRCVYMGVRLDRQASTLIARKAGLTVHPRVTKKVQLLVDCDPGGMSANQLKATEYGIRSIPEESFWEGLGVKVEPAPWVPPRTRYS